MFVTFTVIGRSMAVAQSPQFEWAVRAGGTDSDLGFGDAGITTDSTGNVLVTGAFRATAQFNGTTLTNAGNDDAFIGKYDNNGNLLWVRGVGGAGSDGGFGIATDSTDNIFVTGIFEGTVDFGGTTLVNPRGIQGGQDIFVAKYSSSGALIWATRAGALSYNGVAARGIAVDLAGNVFVTGRFNGTADFSGTMLGSAGDDDIFVAKYDVNGSLLWVRSAGGGGGEGADGLAVDRSGNVVITGRFRASVDFSGTLLTPAGDLDVFLAKYDPSGVLLWVKRAGGVGEDFGKDIAIDSTGNIVITGGFEGTATFGGLGLVSTGAIDAFVAKYDANGDVVWARRAGGEVNDLAFGITTAGVTDDVFVTGFFQRVADFSGTALSSLGQDDVFVVKYDALGDMVWVKSAGGSLGDVGSDIAVDVSGGVSVIGTFRTTANFDETVLTSAGQGDIFVAKLADGDTTPPTITTCAPGQSANADATCHALVPDFTMGVDAMDSNGPLTVTQSPAAGTLVGLGATTVTLTVKDAANNASTCTTSFMVNDATPPVITTCAPSQSASANASCQAAVPDFTGGVVASDCNGPLTVTQSPAAGTLVGLGATTVTLTVKDVANNASTCTTSFTVNDATPPVITTCAPAQSASANASCQAAVPDFTSGVVASDCNGPLTVAQSPAAGTLVGLGATTVTLTVKDAANNASTCTTSFTVNDATPPVITTCAPAQSASANASCQAAVPDFTVGVVATDCNGPLTISQMPPVGTLLGVGTHIIALTVSDQAGTVAGPGTNAVEAWVRLFSGPANQNQGRALALDGQGNAYVTGRSFDPATGNDLATVKYDAIGNPQWAVRYNGPANGDELTSNKGIAVDRAGNIYVTGSSLGSGTSFDYVTIKYDSNGNQLWIARYNGPANGSDTAAQVVVDEAGNVYVTGASAAAAGISEFATVKYDSNGNQMWAARYGRGIGSDGAFFGGVAVDSTGNVYVTGDSHGQSTSLDYATLKYDPNGVLLWVGLYAGPNIDRPMAIVIDGSGNSYVTGWSITGSGGNVELVEYVTVKYGANGNQIWIAHHNEVGIGNDQGSALALDAAGNLFVTGQNFTIIKYDTNGNELWATRTGQNLRKQSSRISPEMCMRQAGFAVPPVITNTSL
jgi:hypothetical protein